MAQHDPVHISSFPCHADHVFVSGNYAYAVGGGLLQIVEISSPATPSLIGSITISPQANSVAVSGSYAYVAGGTPAFEIFDISNPSQPIRKGSLNQAKNGVDLIATNVIVSGNYAYVLNQRFFVYEPITNREVNPSLEIIDVVNPAAPVAVSSYGSGHGNYHINGLYVSENTAYFAELFSLRAIDVSVPSAPILKASATISVSDLPRTITKQDNYLYVSNGPGNSLDIFEITDFNMFRRSQLVDGDGGSILKKPMGVAISGNYAFVTSASTQDSGTNTIEVIDIYNDAPGHAGYITTSQLLDQISISGDYAFVNAGSSLEIFSLPAQPNQPAIIFDPIAAKQYGDEPFELSATTQSGQPVNFSIADASIATVNGNVVTILNAGSTIVEAWEGPDAQHPVSSATRNLMVFERIITGIEKPSSNIRELALYPNPAQHTMNINLQNFDASQTATIEIFDLMGRQIFTETAAGGCISTVDVSRLSQGNYLVKVNQSKYIYQRRFFKK